MTFEIRTARPEDVKTITPWTKDTFEWGDYILERVADWMGDPDSEVLVCVDSSDVPLGLTHARMLSETEGWLEGARVHPDHKRSGLGTALNHAGVEWARSRGANVVRLAIETDNEPARRQVEKLGYRVGSEWVAGFIDPDRGFRAPASSRLTASSLADADSAWVFWSTSELASASRGLIHQGWHWRKAVASDLRSAARAQRLLQSLAGWVMLRDGSENRMETMWLAGTAEDLPDLLEGVLDHAASEHVEHLVVKMPGLNWAVEAMRRLGFWVTGIGVFYKPT